MQGASESQPAEDVPRTYSKEAFGVASLQPTGSIQQIHKKTGMLQPSVSPAGSIKVEWANKSATQQAAQALPADAVLLEEVCTSLDLRQSITYPPQTVPALEELKTPASDSNAPGASSSIPVGGAETDPASAVADSPTQVQSEADPCVYLEGHGTAPFQHQAQIDSEVGEKRQALTKMKAALGNQVDVPDTEQPAVQHTFGYTPSQGDHRSAEQKATDEQHAKEQRKTEAALIAKQHKYEKDQERLIQEQAVEAGEALAKQLQQAILAPTPSTAGHGKHHPA